MSAEPPAADAEQPDTQRYFRVPPTIGCSWAIATLRDNYQWRTWCVLTHNHDGPHQTIAGREFNSPDDQP